MKGKQRTKKKGKTMNPLTHCKRIRILPLLIAPALVAIVIAVTNQGLAQTATPMIFAGIIDDFTPVLDANGPWQVSGQWSLTLIGNSGRGDFSVALNMVRAENLTRSAHTHHVTISNGEVTPLANGFQISGNAIITVSGNLAGFSGSPVTVQVTGGSAVPFTNITLTFGGGAVSHFGDQPFHGVLTQR
jgi:hypothetical protein